MKKDLISKFMMNTMKDRNIMGDEQYIIRVNVWMIGLHYAMVTCLILIVWN